MPTLFELVDIRQTYFLPHSLLHKLLSRAIVFPLGICLIWLHDTLTARREPLQRSGTIYLKLRKPEQPRRAQVDEVPPGGVSLR